jgi:hypothetical protein
MPSIRRGFFVEPFSGQPDIPRLGDFEGPVISQRRRAIILRFGGAVPFSGLLLEGNSAFPDNGTQGHPVSGRRDSRSQGLEMDRAIDRWPHQNRRVIFSGPRDFLRHERHRFSLEAHHLKRRKGRSVLATVPDLDSRERGFFVNEFISTAACQLYILGYASRATIGAASVGGTNSLFNGQGHWLNVAMADPLDFKFVDNLRPPCSRCGGPLKLTRIEPEEPGFDLRTYYCAACESSEFIIAAIK